MLISSELQQAMFAYDIPNERAYTQLQYDILHMLFLHVVKNPKFCISVLIQG